MTRKVMSGIAIVACLAVAVLAVGQGRETQDGAFIHVTRGADDAHRLLMALNMAVIQAEGNRPVLVYCDIDAVKVLTQDAPDVSMEPFPSLHTLLDRLQELDVRVRACPGCMKAAGITAEQLRNGVETANRDEFFTFTSGRILSFDY